GRPSVSPSPRNLGKGGRRRVSLSPDLAPEALPPAHRRRPVRPQDPPPSAAAGRRGARLRPGAALPAGNRLRRLLRAPAAAEEAVPRHPLAPRPHLVVRRAEQLDGSPQAPLSPLRAGPRPLHRRPRHRRLEGRGRALQARPPRRRAPARRAPTIPRKPPAILGATPRDVARNGPEPMPPQFEPKLWPMIAHRGSHESWHHRDRREVERDLVR